MGNSCRIKKTCAVCKVELHNLEFHSNDKGRIDIKRFCKSCRPIYKGIRKGIFEESKYVGKKYNCSVLDSNSITVLEDKTKKKVFEVSLEEAKKVVKKGRAHVISSNEIQLQQSIHFYQQEWFENEMKKTQSTIELNFNPNKLSKKDFISLLNENGSLAYLIDFEEAKLLISEKKATVIDRLSVRLLHKNKDLVLSYCNQKLAI